MNLLQRIVRLSDHFGPDVYPTILYYTSVILKWGSVPVTRNKYEGAFSYCMRLFSQVLLLYIDMICEEEKNEIRIQSP